MFAAAAIGAGIAALTATRIASAGLSLVYPPPPFGFPAGQSYSQLGAHWWQWALTQPADKSPLNDATGANCASGQQGLVWFLVGSSDPSGAPVKRSCTVPYGKTIVFPIANSEYSAFTTDPPDQRTESFVRSQVTNVESATNLSVEIDGIPVVTPKAYLEKSTLFSVTLPDNNIYGLPAGFVLSPSVDEGYYIALQPLTPGHHTLHFHADWAPAPQEVTYDLTVR
jgi:hypothetical protein